MKHFSKVLALVIALALLLPAAAGFAAEQKIMLNYIGVGNTDTLVESFERWKEKTGSAQYELNTEVAAMPSDLMTLLTTRFLGNAEFDMFGGNTEHLMEFNSYCLDLTGKVDTSVLMDVAVQVSTIDGRLCGLPNTLAGQGGVYYDKAAFDKLGLAAPKTFGEFIEVCKALKANGYETMATGMAEDNGCVGWFTEQAFANAHIPENVDDMMIAGEFKMNGPEVTAMMEMFKEMWDSGCFVDGALGTSYSGAVSYFAQGSCALLNNGTWCYSDISKAAPDMELGYFIWPDREGNAVPVATPNGFMFINKNTPNADACISFMQYYYSTENMQLLYDKNPAIYTNTKINVSDPMIQEFTDCFSAEGGMLTFVTLSDPPTDRVFYEILPGAIIKIFKGMSIEQALDEAQMELETRIEEY